MGYLNIDTQAGVLAVGNSPYEVSGPMERQRDVIVELWAEEIEQVTEPEEVPGIPGLASVWDGDFEIVEAGHAWGRTSVGAASPNVFQDSILFERKTLGRFRVERADPPITVIRDGEVLARNVEEYESSLLHRPMVQAGLGIVGVAVATGFVGRWLGWW